MNHVSITSTQKFTSSIYNLDSLRLLQHTMSTSERQSNLDQTLTSVISLLENEQTLKKVRPVSFFGGSD